jgi:hypothetical protein
MSLKIGMGILSVTIMLAAYALYLWQTTKWPNIKPHPFSWLLWGVVTGVAFLIQLAGGAGPGCWVMGLTCATCIVIGSVSLIKQPWEFSRFDWLSVLAATMVFIYYLLSRSPTQSAILTTLVDVFGYGPTIRKGWEKPYDDSFVSFLLNSMKFIPSLFAMESYSLTTCLYPSALIVMNGAVAGILLLRRRQLASPCGSRS